MRARRISWLHAAIAVSVAAHVLGSPAAAGRDAKAIRLALAPDLPAEAAAGARFGLDEAAHTARVLGVRVERADAGREPGRVAGQVCWRPACRALPGVPVMILAPAASGRSDACSFFVAPLESDRRDRLAGWRAGRQPPADSRLSEWHASLGRFGAAELNERYLRATGRGMSAEAWRGWFAVKVLVESALRLRRDGEACAAIGAGRFDGHKGRALTFDPRTGILRQPLYVVAGDSVVDEIHPR